MRLDLLVLLPVIGGIVAILWLFLTRHRLELRVEGDCIFRGRRPRDNALRISEIKRILLAGFFDVAPADYRWIVEDMRGGEFAFFHRNEGADAVLRAISKSYPDFVVTEALARERAEAHFEENIEVWTRR